MAVTLTNIETLVRYLLGDYSHTMIPGDIMTHVSSSVYTPTESNVISVSSVLQNDVALASGDWSYNSARNKVTITATLSAGDTVELQYTYYPNYSTTEINNFTRAALIHLSTNHYYNFKADTTTIYPEPEETEKNLIALVTSLLIEPNNTSYSLPDLRINAPKDLPLHDKISKVIAIAKKNTHGVFTLV